MIVHGHERLLVQGITGKQATFWTEQMQGYGTRVVAGVNPRKAGIVHSGVPVFATAAEAAAELRIDVSVMFVPPLSAGAAALDAIEAQIPKLVILTEHIPVHDVMYLLSAARDSGVEVVGPNTAGLVTPGECFVGFMPAFEPSIFRPGRVGIISRSGSLGTLMCLNVVQAGFGQSAFIGIGGDPVLGTTTVGALRVLDDDQATDAVVVVGEIGGQMEEEAARYAHRMDKPVIAFVAGRASPPETRMGHAGAIVSGGRGSYTSKRAAFEEGGANVIDTPSAVGEALREVLT